MKKDNADISAEIMQPVIKLFRERMIDSYFSKLDDSVVATEVLDFVVRTLGTFVTHEVNAITKNFLKDADGNELSGNIPLDKIILMHISSFLLAQVKSTLEDSQEKTVLM